MNIKKISLALIAILAILAVNSCKSNKNWAVKIDDDVMTIDDFHNYYYTQNKLVFDMSNEEIDKLSEDPEITKAIPTLNKKMFMEQLIALKLIEKKLQTQKNEDEKKFETTMELLQLQAYSMYYVSEKLKDKVKISSEEIEKYYYSHPEISNRLPLNKIVEAQIKQQLTQEKAKEQGIGPNTFIGDLVAESKINKEGFENYLKNQEKKKATQVTTEKKDEKKDTK